MEMESRVEKDMPCESTQNLEDSLLFSTREGAGIGQASWMWMLRYVSSVFKEAMGLDRPRENGGKALCTKEGRQKCLEHVKGMTSRPIWPESSPSENSVSCPHCLLWGIELSASPCH